MTPLKTSVLLLALVLPGCYGSAPPTPPRIPLPAIDPGAEVVVRSETSTSMQNVTKKAYDCPQGHTTESGACRVGTYSVREPVTSTSTTAIYRGKPLSPRQLYVMADPEHEARRERLEELRMTCAKANLPRKVGLSMTVAGLVLWGLAAGTKEPVLTYVGAGAFAVGGASFTYGYFAAGGRQCREANEVARQVIGPYGLSSAEMAELSQRFNARAQHRASN